MLGRTEMRTRDRMYCQTIRSVWDISRGDRARIATCSLRTSTDRLKANYSIDNGSLSWWTVNMHLRDRKFQTCKKLACMQTMGGEGSEGTEGHHHSPAHIIKGLSCFCWAIFTHLVWLLLCIVQSTEVRQLRTIVEYWMDSRLAGRSVLKQLRYIAKCSYI